MKLNIKNTLYYHSTIIIVIHSKFCYIKSPFRTTNTFKIIVHQKELTHTNTTHLANLNQHGTIVPVLYEIHWLNIPYNKQDIPLVLRDSDELSAIRT